MSDNGIERAEFPRVGHHRGRLPSPIFDAIRKLEAGECIRVQNDGPHKRNTAIKCANRSGIRIRTAIQDGYLYIQRIAPDNATEGEATA